MVKLFIGKMVKLFDLICFSAGCHKRAYCSKKCQKKDWKDTGLGQGHKVKR